MDPIYTTIINKTGVARAINWAGAGRVWLDTTSTDVPFDVWSVADKATRNAILTAIREGSVELILHVRTNDEFEHIPFNPDIEGSKPKVVPVKQVEKQTTAALVDSYKADDEKHTIKAVTADATKAAEHYGVGTAAFEAPIAAHVEGASTQGFQKVDDPNIHKTEIAGNEEEKQDNKAVFDQAVAAKDWDKALQALIDEFGKEKITFTARTIMAMKEWSAIVSKYGLA